MSQAENNQSNAPKQPRLYQRGNDQINLDDYIRNLESGFDTWLNSKRIKDKQKEAVREAYRNMVTRINSGDNTFTSRFGGGFQDSTGVIKNATDGFDAVGLAASYLGNTLRSMDIYKQPEPTPDPSKIKYSEGAIGTALTRRLLGSAGTIQDFIDRDQPDKKTKIRSNSVRSKDFRELLRTTATDLRAGTGEFSEWTADQRNKSASDLESLFTVFDNDGKITDDEYLQLAKITGMSDLRRMFTTASDTPPPTDDGTAPRSGRTYADFIRWVNRTYKPYTGTMASPIKIEAYDLSKMGPNIQQTLGNALSNASIADLTGIIKDIVSGKRANQVDFISRIFPSINPFNDENQGKNFLLSTALNLLRNKTADANGGLYNFGESNLGGYYIGGTYTDRNTGFVWDSNNNTISEMSIHNIPYWQTRIRNEWDATQGTDAEDLNPILTSSYDRSKFKKGGVLFAKDSAVLNRSSGRGPGITGPNPWIANPTLNANYVNTWDNYYDITGIMSDMQTTLQGMPRYPSFPPPKLKDDDPNASLSRKLLFSDLKSGNYSQAQLNAYLDQEYGPGRDNKFWDYGYQVDKKGKPVKGADGKDAHGISASQLGILLNRLNQVGANLSFDKDTNGKGYNAWNRIFDQTGLNIYFGGDSGKFDYMGPSTYGRHLLLQNLQNTYTKDNALKIGDSSIYYDGKRWQLSDMKYQPKIISDTTIDKAKIKPEEVPTPSFTNETDVKSGWFDKVLSGAEKGLQTALKAAPELTRAARLATSINANNKINDIGQKALSPVLKDTYERYSPVTGAFGSMQFKNMQAAEALSAAHRAFTSDANLAVARMLEGQRQANDLQSRGFLEDNMEIRRTQAEALSRQEDNAARRSEVANFNRASQNQTSRERAQLEATRINKNWQSLDNYLGEIYSDMSNNKNRRLYLQETMINQDVERWYNELIRPAEEARQAWARSTEAKDKTISDWEGYDKYIRFMREAEARKGDYNRTRLASVYGEDNTSLYTNPLSWATFQRNGGILRQKQTDFISQIIKLNNERNS